MIGPVSSTGRTMMTSLQAAIDKGMPVDQAVAYVKSMAMDGIAPLADLYSMMMQFQRLKEPQRRPPEGGNIRQQLNMIENMQDPMQQGIGSMDAGAMENPQGFNAGGIVAFQEGGVPRAPFDPQEMMNKLMPFLDKPREEVVDEQMAQRDALAKKYGLGPYGEYRKAQQAQAQQMEAELPGQVAEERKLDRAEFFFGLAAAAAEPGTTFATALGKAGSGYTKASRATNARIRDLQKDAREAGLKMLEAEELRKRGDLDNSNKLYDEGRKQALDTGFELYKIGEENKRAEEMRETIRYQSDASLRGLSGVEARLARAIENDPNLSTSEKLERIRGLGKRASGDVALLKAELSGIDRRITQTEKDLAGPTAQIPGVKQMLEERLEELEMKRANILSQAPELGTTTSAPAQDAFRVVGSRPAQ